MDFKEFRQELNRRLIEREDEIISLRRHFYENPELSFEEKETSEFIEAYYRDLDCNFRTRVGGGYGIVVDIEGGKPGRKLAIRGDMDALPIEDQSDFELKSKNKGVMHACGHDGHTAYLMVLAKTLIELKDSIPGSVRIIHQPAEETYPGGALTMIEGGCLEGVDHIVGAHLMSSMKLGEVAYREGAVQTGRASFSIDLEGVGGHGSAPHEANDTIVGASYLITSLQTIVSRRLSPFDNASVTIGSFDGAGGSNTINHRVKLMGDIRLMQEFNREKIEQEFKRIVQGTCSSFDLKYDIDYRNDYIVLENDENLTRMVAKAIEDAGIENISRVYRCEPQTPSEDFSYYAKERPACFFYIGAIEEGQPSFPHHHPKFYIDERSLLIAARAVGSSAADYLFNAIDA